MGLELAGHGSSPSGKSQHPLYIKAMDIYEIKYLDCSKKENRKLLAKKAIKILGTEELPTKENLKKICHKISKKYKMPMKVYRVGNQYQVNITNQEGISIFLCLTPTEVYLKYILYTKAWLKYKKEVNKFK